MRFRNINECREAKRQYKYYIERHRYIDFEEFVEYEYRNVRFEEDNYNFVDSIDFDSVNTSSKKSNTNSNCEYRRYFDSVNIEPASELDKQTWNRWTKGESLAEQWEKLK